MEASITFKRVGKTVASKHYWLIYRLVLKKSQPLLSLVKMDLENL